MTNEQMHREVHRALREAGVISKKEDRREGLKFEEFMCSLHHEGDCKGNLDTDIECFAHVLQSKVSDGDVIVIRLCQEEGDRVDLSRGAISVHLGRGWHNDEGYGRLWSGEAFPSYLH